MWNEICRDYIPVGCYLLDINGNKIDRGNTIEDCLGFPYKIYWNTDNMEWTAISLRENHREYFLTQERIIENGMKIVKSHFRIN